MVASQTTFAASVTIVDLPVGGTVTGFELLEAVQTTNNVGQSVQLAVNQIFTAIPFNAGVTVDGGLQTTGSVTSILIQMATSVSLIGSLKVASSLAPVAGGTTTGLALGNDSLGVVFGSGAPSLSAGTGSLYLRTDGNSISTRLYVNTDGASTWTNFTTAA